MLINAGNSSTVVVPQTTSITSETTKDENTGPLTIRMDPKAKGLLPQTARTRPHPARRSPIRSNS